MKKKGRDRKDVCRRCGGDRFKTVDKRGGEYQCRKCGDVVRPAIRRP